MINSVESTAKNTSVNGYNPSFDKLKLRTKKNNKVYYRTVTDQKTGEIRTIENCLKDKPLFSPKTIEIYGYYWRLNNMGNGFVCPSIKKVCDVCACSSTAVSNANDILTEHNLIGIERTGRSNSIIIVPLDDNGFPIESSGEFATAKALNSKYRNQQSSSQKSTKLSSDINKVDFSYNSKIQSNREFKSGPPHESPPQDIPKFDPAAKELAIADGIKKIRKILDRDPFANKQLSRSLLTNAIASHGLSYLLVLAEDCLSEKIPYLYFSKGVHKENGYEKQNRKVSRDAEAQAIKEQQEHAKDIDAIINDTPDRQSLTKPLSDQYQPINPKKSQSLEDEKLRYRHIENLDHEPDDAFQQSLLKAGILKDMNQIEPES